MTATSTAAVEEVTKLLQMTGYQVEVSDSVRLFKFYIDLIRYSCVAQVFDVWLAECPDYRWKINRPCRAPHYLMI